MDFAPNVTVKAIDEFVKKSVSASDEKVVCKVVSASTRVCPLTADHACCLEPH